MTVNLLNTAGNWNPQLFRELKGRLTGRNMAIAAVISIGAQIVLLLSYLGKLPAVFPEKIQVWTSGNRYIYKSIHRYCTESLARFHYNQEYECVADTFGKVTINWQQWWLDLFVILSILLTFGVLVFGTYAIISDRSTEERQGTFNFVRLSPQSATTISMGKLLGVPSLIYVAALAAMPLHFMSALSAGVPLLLVMTFYAWFAAITVSFFSVAMLLGSVGYWLGGMLPWMGSGLALITLWIASVKEVTGSAVDGLNFFSPNIILHDAIESTGLFDRLGVANYNLQELQFFSLPIGQSALSTVAVSFLIFGFGTYWMWQGLRRCFFNPEVSIWSKTQSYFLIAGSEFFILGFSLQDYNHYWPEHHIGLFLPHLTFFLVTIAALTPQRQTLFDWARFRHCQRQNSETRPRSLLQDLLFSEKSPALLAIAVNVAIAAIILSPAAIDDSQLRVWEATMTLICASNLILIYAAIAQLMLMLKTRKRAIWALAMMGSAIAALPIAFYAMLRSESVASGAWVFAVFPAFGDFPVQYVSVCTAISAAIAQWLAIGLFSLILTRQLQKAGASETLSTLRSNSSSAISLLPSERE